jgi:hypothetical protein
MQVQPPGWTGREIAYSLLEWRERKKITIGLAGNGRTLSIWLSILLLS